MFVTKQVFDPALEGKAVIVSGLQVGSKVVLIGEVHDDKICVVDQSGLSMFLKSEDFRQGELSLEILEPKPPKPMRTTPGGQTGRKVYNKHNRTDQEIKEDEQAVMDVLSIGKPVLLRDIIKYVNSRLGKNRWTNKNASGFLAYMMRKGLPIEKVDYGRYRYKGETV